MITIAHSLAEAAAAPGELRAGATDVQERRNRGVAAGPIVDISRLPGLNAIEWAADGAATIGALVTVARLASDPDIGQHYPGLAQAAAGLATPQIRAMATAGGCLLQRSQCPYFRHPAFTCFKRGGHACPARDGQHADGGIFDLGPCVYPHPSTLGMALLAYDAQVTVYAAATRSVADLYGDGTDPTRDHLLREHEILTGIMLPPPLHNERAAYFRAISRAAAEWPLVEALARLQLDAAGAITLARVAVGGVANVPLRLPNVEAALLGQKPTSELLAQAADSATAGAQPLPQTGYKTALLVGTVLEVLENALL